MATPSQLQRASFSGIEFEFVDLEDGRGHAVVEHKYPGQNGADLELMGAEPETHSGTVVFLGEQGEAQWRSLESALLAGQGTLVHPVKGARTAVCKTWRERREASDRIQVSLEFEVAGSSARPLNVVTTRASAAQAVSDAITQTQVTAAIARSAGVPV